MEKRERKALKTEAKALLSDDDYKKFSLALKTFSKTKDVEKLGFELCSNKNRNEQTSEIVRLTTQFLSGSKRAKFMETVRNLETRNNWENCDPNRRNSSSTCTNPNLDCLGANDFNSRPCKNEKRSITMERSSLQIDFGFRIKGDLFVKQEIIVGKVDKDSIAAESGMKEGIRIVSLNGSKCKRARKADVIHLVKNSLRLCLEVVYLDKGTVANAGDMTAIVKHVTICSSHSGWLGLSVRGGSDYGCGIYISSVDDASPAERAGLHVGDVIKEVNHVMLDGKTHIQAVEQIVTTCPPISFTVQTNRDQGAASIQAANARLTQPRTPLRIINNVCRSRVRSIPEQLTTDWVANISIDSLCIQGSPPPPYSEEPPESHRVFQRGGPNENNTEGPCTDHIYDIVENLCNEVSSSLSDSGNRYDSGNTELEISVHEDHGLSNFPFSENGGCVNCPPTDHIYDNVASESSDIHQTFNVTDSGGENPNTQFQGISCHAASAHIYDEVYNVDNNESAFMTCDLTDVNHDYENYHENRNTSMSTHSISQQNHVVNANHGDNGNQCKHSNHGNSGSHSNNGNYGSIGNLNHDHNNGNNGNHGNNRNFGHNGNHSDDGSYGNNHGCEENPSSLLNDIQNFKKSTLRKSASSVATSENGTREQQHENLLSIINTAIINRGRGFESSVGSSNDSCDSLSDWDL